MYVFGKNVVSEYIKNKMPIKKVYLIKNFNDFSLLENIKDNNINIVYKEKYELDKMVNGMHQGIILEVKDYEYADLNDFTNDENSIVLILDHLEDPHNFGAIIRTAEAANINGIIIPKDRAVLVNSTVVKVSTGATSKVKIACVTNLSQTISKLKEKGFWIIGTDMVGTRYDKIDYKGKIAIVIGNEGSGMSNIVKQSCDFIATIPMLGEINSLNASVSAGIIIYEAIKSRLDV